MSTEPTTQPADALGSATTAETDAAPSAPQGFGSATYEIIRRRLLTQATLLRDRMRLLDARRQEVFGTIESKLLQADRVVTSHNCVPQDMVQLGRGRFLFGFNVRFGLKKEIELGDVFAVYNRDAESGTFKEGDLGALQCKPFITDFKRLYNVYEKSAFKKFSLIDGSLYMVFSIGTGASDIAVFKWAFEGGQLRYLDGRAESDFRKVGFPSPHEFRWLTPNRESFRYGDHPHISIEDRVFVECIGGDLTFKVEDNTATGVGLYSEPVEDKNQKVDDAQISYAIVGHLILLRIRPYKETVARHFIFNAKQPSVSRVDTMGQSCALLPEDHGLIFPDGYYLATGELKRFESREANMTLERVVTSPTGEDSLYVFYSWETGQYALLPYRLISQKVDERITCHGFCLFADGHLLLFRADDEPQKHHMVQLRQTPFYQAGHEPPGQREAFLYQVGNKEVVRCLAETNEVLTLALKETPYAELYSDLVMRCGAIIDSYPWLSHPEGQKLDAALRETREAADKAVDEFDKVRRLHREAAQRVNEVRKRCEDRLQTMRRASFRALEDFVQNLAALRHLRGELITLKEVRYAELAEVEALEKSVVAASNELSKACVRFLLLPTALESYRTRTGVYLASVDKVTRVADGKKLEKAADDAGAELEMLIEVVNSLQIEDATEATRIIDGITSIYSTLNQVKAALKNRLQSLGAAEGAAQFSAQTKLLAQSAASYLDLCVTPAKCEEYLNRVSVQLEELEGMFADFEDYTVQLAEKRAALYEAFEQRKIALIEQRNRRTASLMVAAERVLKAVQNRLGSLKTIEEINSTMASDVMISKVREIIAQLLELEDSVKADELLGKLKSAQQEAARQLKDRQELFAGGPGLIQLGKHRFNTNAQPLDLTVVNREGIQHLHLTSTKFFEPITDAEFLATREVWDQEVVSETAQVYRAEYLAHRLLGSLRSPVVTPPGSAENATSGGGHVPDLATVLAMTEAERISLTQAFMGDRYEEGYTKGVHDQDGARIFEALLKTHVGLGLARYRSAARAFAVVYWHRFCLPETRAHWDAKLSGFSKRNRLFPGDPTQPTYIAALGALLAVFTEQTPLFARELAAEAAEYLFHELVGGGSFVASLEAQRWASKFHQQLVTKGSDAEFVQARIALANHPASEFELVRDWVQGFLLHEARNPTALAGALIPNNTADGSRGDVTQSTGILSCLDEVVAMVFCGETPQRQVVGVGTTLILDGMRGGHALVRNGRYVFDYFGFRERLERHDREVIPRFEVFHRLKRQLLERERTKLRLDSFKSRVLTSFVRNQLIDHVYLPLVGDNLAKQIGAAGAAKRTDLMGLLLLISPPGYGKTTLMEYVANRLGIVFVKINGPALGHGVTSLDPEEAPNAAAREEVEKLNLALEMGDNVMLCLDDIQHCHPEFLQKFISLCDGQRKIEGVWRGKSRTYDLRGRKVVVVMAGNPYTESGQKFKIPDMLANRADTYNLGDIIGSSAEWFKASYLENAVTSNAALAHLASKSQKDIHAFIRLAGGGERDPGGFEGSYSAQEIEEILSVMRKLVVIREIVLKVNLEYIHSAAQADEFRTEPPFRLQGSYRNMNRLAEKVVPIMNNEEVMALVLDHYRGESQTLTTGAESNLLKFKELIGLQTPEEQARWDEIKKTFKRHQWSRAGDQSDPMGRVVGQLSGFQAGLQSIQETLEKQLSRAIPTAASDKLTDRVDSLSHELEMIHSTLATLKDVASRQRDHLRATEDLLAARAKQGTLEIELTQEMMSNEKAFVERFHQVLAEVGRSPESTRIDTIKGGKVSS